MLVKVGEGVAAAGSSEMGFSATFRVKRAETPDSCVNMKIYLLLES
jgi:hypothetical protein